MEIVVQPQQWGLVCADLSRGWRWDDKEGSAAFGFFVTGGELGWGW